MSEGPFRPEASVMTAGPAPPSARSPFWGWISFRCLFVDHFEMPDDISFSFSSNIDAILWFQSRETTFGRPRESQLAVVERGMQR